MIFKYKTKDININLCDVDFICGLGIVKFDYFFNEISGVIDKGGNIIIPFEKKYIEFNIIDNDNIIIYEKDTKKRNKIFESSDYLKENTFVHYKMKKDILNDYVLPDWVFEIKNINNLIYALIDKGHNTRAFYNIECSKICTPMFDIIEKSCENNLIVVDNEVIPKFKKGKLIYDKTYVDDKLIDLYFCSKTLMTDYANNVEVVTYIDNNGDFISPIYDSYNCEMFGIENINDDFKIKAYNEILKKIYMKEDNKKLKYKKLLLNYEE